jgi:hypothetical protein
MTPITPLYLPVAQCPRADCAYQWVPRSQPHECPRCRRTLSDGRRNKNGERIDGRRNGFKVANNGA